MKYRRSIQPSVSVPSLTGAQVDIPTVQQVLIPWQPSTWPRLPNVVDASFIAKLDRVFRESMLDEIGQVIEDARTCNGDLQHRGHVVAIALMCALDAIAAYGYRGKDGWKQGQHIENFVKNHFPKAYRPYAQNICVLYRNCLIHSWNLFEASIPGSQVIRMRGSLCFGLLNFFSALRHATRDYLRKLRTDAGLQTKTLERYQLLRQTARP